ncbi:netrin receptor UNC5C isoform X2 [Onthophagus taurus]|uniref:netrin receptor UNC5C isoform X2 n=1 Tax=Onthophagus taurus TaxID=166361 RepID=UPI0039BE48C3
MAAPGVALSLTLILAFFLAAVRPNQDDHILDDKIEDPAPTKSSEEPEDTLLTIQDSEPLFLQEPSDAFVVKTRPATLRCKAAHALQVYFKCNGERLETIPMSFVDPQSGVRIVEAEINVTRDMVEEYFGKDKFKCECHAYNGARGTSKSQPATIEVAYLKKQFGLSPPSMKVELGQQMELSCVPPQGLPPPRVYWLRGDMPLQSDTSVIVSSEGHLLIGQARAQDTGNYTCVAENLAAKRMAPPVQITVFVNGGWSAWSPWKECSCPGASLPKGKMRTRTCTQPTPSNGGSNCIGPEIQRNKECQPCPPEVVVDAPNEFNDVDLSYEPKWSQWSDWSECTPDCTRTRRRQCLTGPPRSCLGKDTQTGPCTSELCPTTQLNSVREANLANTQTDLALYIGLTLAVFLVTLLSFLLLRAWRKKGQHQSLYNMTANDYHPEFFPEHDKKSLALQPDLTQTVPPCYEYPYPASSVTRSVSEHHYDVPHLASGSDIQMSPATSSTLESSSGKRSQLSGFTNNSDSTYEVATESVTLPLPSLPTAYAVSPATSGTYTVATVTSAGTHLNLPGNEISLLIPEGAVGRGRKSELFLSILNEDCFRPRVAETVTQLSPVISCGPNISLNKSVIIKIPHCADLSRNNWSIIVLQSDCSDSQWQTAVTLGQETINTELFCQLDRDKVYLVTDTLSRFVIVGHSVNGYATKRLKLAVFAPKLCTQSCMDYNVRVYVLEDTESSMETVFSQEKRLGGYLLEEPKSINFQDGGNALCLHLENISEGWKAKPSSNYQEIPFKHLWQANSNSLHCSFSLEAIKITRILNFKIRVNQKSSEHYQNFDITCRDDTEMSNRTNSAKTYNELLPKVTVQSETTRSANDMPRSYKNQPTNQNEDLRSAKNLEAPKLKNLILTNRGVSTCDDFVFRLDRNIRKQICQCLDPPTQRGNDWRMLAHALSVDRYINFFATKPSPTDCILDLWEARNRQSNAMTELVSVFKDMERMDAVKVMESILGPNWL